MRVARPPKVLGGTKQSGARVDAAPSAPGGGAVAPRAARRPFPRTLRNPGLACGCGPVAPCGHARSLMVSGRGGVTVSARPR